MRNIIVITRGDTDTLSLIDICNEWRENFSIIAARKESDALQLLKSDEYDLVIADLASRPEAKPAELYQLTTSFAYVPCIAVINPERHKAEDFLGKGVSTCLESPADNDTLFRWVNELLDIATSGTLQGLPIHSLLQMIEGEGRTCTLKITQKSSPKEKKGFIYTEKGAVIAAETADLTGEQAVYKMISWENATAEIRYYNSIKEHQIDKTLMSLLMEAFRLKDENASSREPQKKGMGTRELKHFSTTGKGLLFESGLKCKIEVTRTTDPFPVTLIGSVPGQYLIVNKPKNFDQSYAQLQDGERMVVKYLKMGRLCMFKTDLITAMDDPSELLFLEYPNIIHYHELRRARRTTTFIPCNIVLPGNVTLSAVLLDISSKGCLCQIKANRNKALPELEIGDNLQIFGLFPGIREEQELIGTVKNTKRTKAELKIGVELLELSESIKSIIGRYLDTLGES